jgi:hypothetical protein
VGVGWTFAPTRKETPCFTNREARFLAGLKNEQEFRRLIVAAQELALLQQRQASLGRTIEIDPPLETMPVCMMSSPDKLRLPEVRFLTSPGESAAY